MSNAAINAVVAHSRSRGIARLVLVLLADRADPSGSTWCGTRDIATRAGIARTNVSRVVNELRALGELEVRRGAGRHGTNIYTISPRLMTMQPPATPVSPRSEESLTTKQPPSQGDAHTPLNPIEPQKQLPFSSPEFAEAWKTWLQHRKEKRQPLTPTATRRQLEKLAALGEARALAALHHSLASGYTGLFEPKAPPEKPRYLPDGRPMNAAAERLAPPTLDRSPL